MFLGSRKRTTRSAKNIFTESSSSYLRLWSTLRGQLHSWVWLTVVTIINMTMHYLVTRKLKKVANDPAHHKNYQSYSNSDVKCTLVNKPWSKIPRYFTFKTKCPCLEVRHSGLLSLEQALELQIWLILVQEDHLTVHILPEPAIPWVVWTTILTIIWSVHFTRGRSLGRNWDKSLQS